MENKYWKPDRKLLIWDCPNYGCISIATQEIVSSSISLSYEEAIEVIEKLTEILKEKEK